MIQKENKEEFKFKSKYTRLQHNKFDNLDVRRDFNNPLIKDNILI